VGSRRGVARARELAALNVSRLLFGNGTFTVISSRSTRFRCERDMQHISQNDMDHIRATLPFPFLLLCLSFRLSSLRVTSRSDASIPPDNSSASRDYRNYGAWTISAA
jgi:hypothetical protein